MQVRCCLAGSLLLLLRCKHALLEPLYLLAAQLDASSNLPLELVLLLAAVHRCQATARWMGWEGGMAGDLSGGFDAA